jgi:transcriptional regulator with XRE-family HTH domain
MGAAVASRLRLSREFPWTAFGVVLRTLRLEAQLSQRELERKAGLAPASVSSYERGKARPSQKTVEALLTALDASLPEVVSALDGMDGRDASAGASPARPTKAALGHLDFFLADLSAMVDKLILENQERNDPSQEGPGVLGDGTGQVRTAGG